MCRAFVPLVKREVLIYVSLVPSFVQLSEEYLHMFLSDCLSGGRKFVQTLKRPLVGPTNSVFVHVLGRPFVRPTNICMHSGGTICLAVEHWYKIWSNHSSGRRIFSQISHRESNCTAIRQQTNTRPGCATLDWCGSDYCSAAATTENSTVQER